jgi:hypothetical protein
MTFATTTDLMPHQETAVAKLLPSRVGALFMDMGTGKSRTLIELARIRQAKVDRVIWFCPVSLKQTILFEILKHTDCQPEDVHVFGSRTSAKTVPMGCQFYVVGIESMASSNRVVAAVNQLITEQTYVVVDESSYIKGYRSIRSQRIINMSARARYRTILTGTPFTQGVIDLYAQMAFLSPKILGYLSFWSFATNHLVYETRKDHHGRSKSTGRIIHTHGWDYLAQKIAPYIYQVQKSECLSLPDKLRENHCHELTKEQLAYYNLAKEDALSRRDPDDWTALWIFKLFTALQTITCGWWNREGELIRIPHERLDALDSVVRSIPGTEKVIVWAKYRHAVEEITGMLASEYGNDSVARFDGTLTEKARNEQLANWRGGGRFLVATQSAGGHGLTLNEAAFSIFYADGFKYSERIQAEDRNHRIGQLRPPTYVTIRSDSKIENRIQTALYNKGNALSAFRQEIELVRGSGIKESAIRLVRSL